MFKELDGANFLTDASCKMIGIDYMRIRMEGR